MTHNRLFLVTTLMCAVPIVVSAQRNSSPGNGTSFSTSRLARIDSTMTRLVAEKKVPGVVAMIVKDGRVVYHKAFGVRDLDSKAPQRIDDIFRIFSQTKAVTSLAAMLLWEEGKFSLDDPVEKFIPEFKEPTVLTKFNKADSTYEAKKAQRRITIRQLFTHSSGIDYASIGSEEFRAIYAKADVPAVGREGDKLGDKMRALGKLPLAHEPGERFTYSLSIDLLGYLVELWSGMPLDRFMRTRIFEPLKMHDTWFELPRDKHTRLVALHEENDAMLKVMRDTSEGVNPNYPVRPTTYFAGGAGLSSTTADYARFLQMFLNGGELDGVRLLSRKTVELILQDHIPRLATKHGLGFALETSETDYRTVLTEGSYYWGGAANTTYWVDPKERLVGLVYTNVLGSTVPLGDLFKTLVYSAMH